MRGILIGLVIILPLFACPRENDNPDSIISICNLSSNAILTTSYDQSRELYNNNFFDSTQYQLGFLKQDTCKNYPDTYMDSFKGDPDGFILFVFDPDTIKYYPWDTIRARKLYLARYEVNQRFLDSLNWKITYE
jgi:uncharacterized protein with NRDE domain